MNYVFGPVPSRRLGRSLGIDPLPSKTCNFQCVYCQLGRTSNFTNERKEYIPKEDIISEMKIAIEVNKNNTDYITIVGSGEPTLYKELDILISKAKESSTKPIAVITNGALLYNSKVRESLTIADAILPSLDAGNEKTFIKINRPHPDIKYNEMMKGFIDFRAQYDGDFLIEVMLVKGINDSKDELKQIKDKIDLINPDRIDINIPTRPPAEKWVQIPDKDILNRLNEVFEEYSNIMTLPESSDFKIYSSDFEKELLSIIERHPMRHKKIINTFESIHLTQKEIEGRLIQLEKCNIITKINYQNEIFWKLTDMSK
jgi:wyosine [tRNA(Phe)-imidazoG37] synthetase (radical SAM superfamily)